MQNTRRKRTVFKAKKKTTRVTVDFPIAEHRKLKAIAALEGVTLQDYIRSRTVGVAGDKDVTDEEINPIFNEIIKKHRKVLKRLASK